MPAFIEVKQVGCCDERSRVFAAIGYRGKAVADDTRPLSSLLIPLIRDLCNFIGYDDEQQMKEDVATVTEMLGRLRWTAPNDHKFTGESK